MTAGSTCPTSEEILRFTGGQFVDDERHDEIERHLAGCPRCGVDLDLALSAVAYVADGEPPHDDAAPPAAVASWARELSRQEKDVHRLMAEPPESWSAAFLAHPDRGDPGFLLLLTDRVVWYADEVPDEVLAFVRVIRGVVSSRTRRDHWGECLALLGLAEGVAWRTKGDHIAALERYDEAERHLDPRVLSHEYARLNLARAASLRYLDRLDEALDALEMARQGFARYTDVVGEAKACWELGNVRYQRFEYQDALPLMDRAIHGFLHEGDAVQLSRARLGKVGVLVALERPADARVLIGELVADPHITGNALEAARLLWFQGRLLALDGNMEEAAAQLRRAGRRLRAAGAPVYEAMALIDVAFTLGAAGDPQGQADAAREAASILEATPGQKADLARAAAALHDALRNGIGLAEVLASLRRHLR